MAWFSPSSKAWGLWGFWCKTWVSKAHEPGALTSQVWEMMDITAQKEEKASALCSPFCSIWSPNGLDHEQPQWWGLTSLLITESNRNTFTDTPRNVLPAICPSLRPVKMTITLTITSSFTSHGSAFIYTNTRLAVKKQKRKWFWKTDNFSKRDCLNQKDNFNQKKTVTLN